MSRHTNQAGIDLIKEFEGCVLTAYLDVGGLLTIGYGHTGPDVHTGQTIDADEAENLLVNDLREAEHGVSAEIAVPVSDNQYGALVSFTYNVGIHNFAQSTLLRKLNDGDYQGAADEFPKWNHVQGKVVAGLTRRRDAERTLFLSGNAMT